MILAQYYLECLSQGSYLIGDESSGQAVVVDPRRDVDQYIADARDQGLTIVGVINTHFHADFVAGHLELAAATGAWIGYGRRADPDYGIRRFADGDKILLGAVELEILETPGHTWESICILVRAHQTDSVPEAILTGDTLFVGDVGRPDLSASMGADPLELAMALRTSVHEVLLPLPDAVRVLPAHGAGSACGKSLSAERESTIGAQRADNPSVQPMSSSEFVALVTSGQPAAPSYFATDALLNRSLHDILAPNPSLAALGPAAVTAAVAAGARIIDTRTPETFADRHLRGAVNVGIDGRFAETAGMFFAVTDPLLIIADPGCAAEAVLNLARIGFDNVVGYLDGPSSGPGELARWQQRSERIDVHELAAAAAGAVVVDVRNAGERADGSIPNTVHIPLAELAARHGELPAGTPVIVHCASGWRSSVGASALRALGHDQVADLVGGYNSWAELNRDVAPA